MLKYRRANSHRVGISAPNDIMNSQALECEYHRCQTCPLDFWNRIFRHALLPEFLGVDPKAFPSRGSSSSAGSLLSLAPNHRKSPKKNPVQISAGTLV